MSGLLDSKVCAMTIAKFLEDLEARMMRMTATSVIALQEKIEAALECEARFPSRQSVQPKQEVLHSS